MEQWREYIHTHILGQKGGLTYYASHEKLKNKFKVIKNTQIVVKNSPNGGWMLHMTFDTKLLELDHVEESIGKENKKTSPWIDSNSSIFKLNQCKIY